MHAPREKDLKHNEEYIVDVPYIDMVNLRS